MQSSGDTFVCDVPAGEYPAPPVESWSQNLVFSDCLQEPSGTLVCQSPFEAFRAGDLICVAGWFLFSWTRVCSFPECLM